MADPMVMDDTADQTSGDDMSQGFCIEIHVDAQGGIKVGVESEAEEAGEEQGAQASDADAEQSGDGAQPVASIKDAVRLVMDIYNNQGQMTTPGQPNAEQSSAAAAFGAARGGKAPMGM